MYLLHGRCVVQIDQDVPDDDCELIVIGQDPISGGVLSSLPRRIARLGGDDRLPPYAVATADGPASDLEPLVSRFLEDHGQRAEHTRSSLPPGLQERLRALGYLD